MDRNDLRDLAALFAALVLTTPLLLVGLWLFSILWGVDL